MAQVKIVFSALDPAAAPVEVVQAEAAPTPKPQVMEPAGAVAPTTPVTVAV